MRFEYGFYVFLGHGDYHKPDRVNTNWISTWRLEDWKSYIQKIASIGATQLLVYLNGHFLPYPSKAFPELVESTHPNVKNEFFSTVIKFAQKNGIQVIAVFTTSGHAGGFYEKNPSLAIKPRSTQVDLETLLTPFPQHIRKNKNKTQNGAAQVGFGTLCHNHPSVQRFVLEMLSDMLSIYPDFDGFALHPPESIHPCFCEFCCEKARIEGVDLKSLSNEAGRSFYLETYLDFQRTILIPKIQSLSNKPLSCFTVPWLFEPEFEKIASKIPRDVALIEWDYNLDSTRIAALEERLLNYQKFGHRLWFMPTAGLGLSPDQDLNFQFKKIVLQIKAAINSGASKIIFFVGPHFSMDLRETLQFCECLKESEKPNCANIRLPL